MSSIISNFLQVVRNYVEYFNPITNPKSWDYNIKYYIKERDPNLLQYELKINNRSKVKIDFDGKSYTISVDDCAVCVINHSVLFKSKEEKEVISIMELILKMVIEINELKESNEIRKAIESLSNNIGVNQK